MENVQSEIELLQDEIKRVNAVIDKAIRERRASGKESPLVPDLNATIATAREALAVVELKLRKLYESRGDD
jgi:hypothetical protein